MANGYTIKASVTVDVEMWVAANSEAEARANFSNHLLMTASLVDVPAENFETCEDSISDVNIENIAAG